MMPKLKYFMCSLHQGTSLCKDDPIIAILNIVNAGMMGYSLMRN